MNELYHHGIKGQKWGVRRFQNYDGTRTEAGKKRANIKTYTDLWKVPYAGWHNAYPNDIKISKNATLSRVTSADDNKFKDRTYVSQNAGTYMDYLWEPGKQMKQVDYKPIRTLTIAGKNKCQEILDKISDEKLDITYENTMGILNKETRKIEGQKLDFYMNNKPLADKFTKELHKQGYDGLLDLQDHVSGFDSTSIILVNDCLKKIGELKFYD